MSTPQNDAFDIRAPKPIDKRYLKNEITPWVSTAEVNAAIVSAYRYQGLTVLIGTVEYWYMGGTADVNLIPKTQTDTILTLTADGFYTFPIPRLIVGIIVTPNIILPAFKAGSSPGGEDFIFTMQLEANVPAAIAVSIWRNAGQSIYFGGLGGSNTSIIIKSI